MPDDTKATTAKVPAHVVLRNSGLSRDAIGALLELISDADAREAAAEFIVPPKPDNKKE